MPITDIEAPAKQKKGPDCSVCSKLDELPEQEAAALVRLLSDKEWRYTELSDALEAQGVNLTAGMLSWHARGRCSAKAKLRR